MDWLQLSVDDRKKIIDQISIQLKLLPQSISFTPPKEVLASWKDDYVKMQSSMIYGDSLPFDQLIKRIEDLNKRFRRMNFE